MTFFRLDADNWQALAQSISRDEWVVACLCAQWCGSCREYEIAFAQLAERHPQHRFVWIDIEDQADVVGDFDVENFPTLLIQRGATVTFFGAMEPEIRLAERIFTTHLQKSEEELRADAVSNAQHREWQHEIELGRRLREAIGDAAA
ncbi:thioredoxin [Oxalobacteraceae bacterium CAVE-383]|nr:thioredoxin [Oxalobacteraceae bacterium CAVE-383]